MNVKLFVIFLVLSEVCTAQKNNDPTRFDKFINRPEISWAAYANDTFDFDNANLNNILLERLIKKKIKATLPAESRTVTANSIKYVRYDSIFNSYFRDKNPVIPVIDSEGEVVEYVKAVPTIDTSTFRLTEITQILYVVNGILKAYIPWVTPTLPVYISSGKYIGESFYFNTAYNYKYNYKHRKRHDTIFLKQTSSALVTNSNETLLKELYGKNLVEVIWPFVLNNTITAYSMPDNKKVDPGNLDMFLKNDFPMILPLYDSINRVFRYDTFIRPLKPKDFTDIILVQDWYYNKTKNIVFNKVRELHLFDERKSASGDKKRQPVLKLVFP